MKGKIWHVVFAIAIVVVGMYTYHMITSHKGQSILGL